MESKSANIILGNLEPGDSFTIKYGIFNLKLSIKLLSLEQVIKISEQSCKIPKIELKAEEDMFNILMANAQYIKIMAKIIAIATEHRFQWLIYKAVMGLPLIHIYTLYKIVRKQSDPQPFFFILSTMERINILKKPEE